MNEISTLFETIATVLTDLYQKMVQLLGDVCTELGRLGEQLHSLSTEVKINILILTVVAGMAGLLAKDLVSKWKRTFNYRFTRRWCRRLVGKKDIEFKHGWYEVVCLECFHIYLWAQGDDCACTKCGFYHPYIYSENTDA